MSETVSRTTAGDETTDATTSAAGARAIEVVATARRAFDRGVTKPREWRVAQPQARRTLLVHHGHEIAEAPHADLGKSATEARATETGFVVREIDHTLRHLRAPLDGSDRPARSWGVPTVGVATVSITLTPLAPTATAAVPACASGTARPAAPGLTVASGRTRVTAVLLPVGADGSISAHEPRPRTRSSASGATSRSDVASATQATGTVTKSMSSSTLARRVGSRSA